MSREVGRRRWPRDGQEATGFGPKATEQREGNPTLSAIAGMKTAARVVTQAWPTKCSIFGVRPNVAVA